MIALVLAVSTTLAFAHPPRVCSDARKAVEIHWSEEKEIRSPDCRWIIEVRPRGEKDDFSEVVIADSNRSTSYSRFRLNRDGAIHWNADGSGLLIEDKEFSNGYRLMLFDPMGLTKTSMDALQINARIRAEVEHALSPGENINYYFPRFVAWTHGGLIVSVGVVTVHGSSSPFTPHCFGYEIATQPLKIQGVLSESNLRKRYKASCQIWP